MKNFLQLLWWNDVTKIPDDKDILVIRSGQFFSNIELYHNGYLPHDAVAWTYVNVSEVIDKLNMENIR